jgi:hypothetical protein
MPGSARSADGSRRPPVQPPASAGVTRNSEAVAAPRSRHRSGSDHEANGPAVQAQGAAGCVGGCVRARHPALRWSAGGGSPMSRFTVRETLPRGMRIGASRRWTGCGTPRTAGAFLRQGRNFTSKLASGRDRTPMAGNGTHWITVRALRAISTVVRWGASDVLQTSRFAAQETATHGVRMGAGAGLVVGLRGSPAPSCGSAAMSTRR